MYGSANVSGLHGVNTIVSPPPVCSLKFAQYFDDIPSRWCEIALIKIENYFSIIFIDF